MNDLNDFTTDYKTMTTVIKVLLFVMCKPIFSAENNNDSQIIIYP